jgi:hypothetical protein
MPQVLQKLFIWEYDHLKEELKNPSEVLFWKNISISHLMLNFAALAPPKSQQV